VVIDIATLATGGNNRLFRLTSPTGERLLAKFYVRDERDRLGREYGALTFLRARGFDQVPQPYLRDDTLGCGVYSFENGAPLAPSAVSTVEAAALGRFAAALHRVRPDEDGAEFPLAVTAAFSIAERLRQIDERLRASGDVPAQPG
jgi:Ser/Thr protein kinase RdoA (MazF antagonist)